MCDGGGKLICCDDCPAAFHAECLGYEKVRTMKYKSLVMPERQVEVLLLQGYEVWFEIGPENGP